MDRMGDFEWVGTANLWKSAPIFSTGAEIMELVTKELRLNLCSRARNSDGSLVSEEQGDGSKELIVMEIRGHRSQVTGQKSEPPP